MTEVNPIVMNCLFVLSLKMDNILMFDSWDCEYNWISAPQENDPVCQKVHKGKYATCDLGDERNCCENKDLGKCHLFQPDHPESCKIMYVFLDNYLRTILYYFHMKYTNQVCFCTSHTVRVVRFRNWTYIEPALTEKGTMVFCWSLHLDHKIR